ncbi:MAG: hypothetical protein C0591_07820 [Marinilabiliales bacterium]|nr:MAG: hypothetical protein C0591_07820 [Marinilabiliales bacterium]
MYYKLNSYLTCALIILFISGSILAQKQQPVIKKSIYYGKSKPVRDMPVVIPGEHPEEQRVIKNFMLTNKELKVVKEKSDRTKPAMQNKQGPIKGKGPLLNFEGIDNVNGGYPADPNGDVSENYYMQSVNNSFAVWDKSGNLLYGPVDNKSLWNSLPGPWHAIQWSDPIFKYDYLADRWVISSMSFNFNQELYYEMVAVSETNDPLGAYNCYVFQFDYVNDYPKLSVWHDGYYLTYNMFEYTDTWYFQHSLVMVIDKEAMIAGESEITMIQFEMLNHDLDRFFPIASDLRGINLPNDSPCYIVTLNSHDTLNPWFISLDVYEFITDWDTPENSGFEQISQFDVGELEPIIYFGPGAPQPINQYSVITIPLYMMYPVTYRTFDEHESMVCCVTIWDGNTHYLKWWELRKEDSDWYIYQGGNYAPDESHRYQPSITMNANGDIAMGYTASDEETFPSIRMTGRRSDDPLGEMTFMELELFTGLNYINTYHDLYDQNRWGDYASMMVDPVNDTTFWFTNMYPKSEATLGNWGTRIFALNLTEEFASVTAFAGNDTVIEPSDYIFATNGEATNYNALEWSSTGDGTFLTNGILNAKYVRGNQDITDGQVQLILQANGYEPGSFATDTMTLTIDTETGIEDLESNALELSVSPNPSNGIVMIRANTGIDKKVILRVYDTKGKQLFTEEIVTKAEQYTRQLDFSLKGDGIYYFRINAGEQVANGKLVKVR